MIKWIQKTAALLTAITLCFTVSVSASADAEAEKSNDFAFGLLQVLGVFDENLSYQEQIDRTVSRGEFAKYMAKLLKTENYIAGGTDAFTDVNSESDLGKTLHALVAMGIIRGDGTGTYRPNDAITVSEVAAVLIRSVNCEYYIGSMSGGMSSYYYTAHRLKLLKGITNQGVAAFGDCVTMMYNALHLEVKSEFSEDETSLLKLIYDMAYVKGRVTANQFTAISGEQTDEVGKIDIDGVEYLCGDDETLHDLLGYRLIVYYTEKDDERTVAYYHVDSNVSVVRIEGGEVEKYSDFALSYYKEGRKNPAVIRISKDAAVIRNGRLVETDYDSAFAVDNGFITVIFNGSKADTVIIETYENVKVTGVDVGNKIIYTEKVSDKSMLTIDFNEQKGKYISFKSWPYGRAVNETMLVTDDLLCISQSLDGAYTRGWLCSQTVSGVIKSIKEDADERLVQIGDESYRVADSYNGQFFLGEQAAFILDITGKIALAAKSAQSNRILGYVYRLADTRKQKIDGEILVKLYNVKREHKTLALADKILLDGERRTNDYVKQVLCTGAGGALKRQPVFYRANEKDEITELDLAAPSKEMRERENTLYQLLPSGSYYWLYSMRTFERAHIVSSKTYYMRVPPESNAAPEEHLFGVQPFSNVTWWNSNGNKSILGLYKYDDSNPYADLILVANGDGAALSNTTEVTMVSEVTQELNSDGQIVTAVRGLRRGVEVKAYFDDNVYRGDIEEGDLIRFATNVKGEIGVYEKIYDQSEDAVLWKMTGTADEYTSNSTPAAGLRYTMGYVNSLYNAPYTDGLNSVIRLGREPDMPEDVWQFNSNAAASTRYIVYDSKRMANKVYMAGLDEVVSWENCRSKDDTSRAFVHTRSGWLIAVFIYK